MEILLTELGTGEIGNGVDSRYPGIPYLILAVAYFQFDYLPAIDEVFGELVAF